MFPQNISMFILSRDPISVQCPDTLYKYIYIYPSFSGRHKDVDERTKRIRWKRFVYDFLVFTQFLVYKTLHHSDIYMCRRLCSRTSFTHTCSIAIRRIKCFGVCFFNEAQTKRTPRYIYIFRTIRATIGAKITTNLRRWEMPYRE